MNSPPGMDPLAGSWLETVQALPTEAEKEELSRFIRDDLREGVGAGILRGLFLLLKANRLYLEHLPERYTQELVQPLRDQFVKLERTLTLKLEAQSLLASRTEIAAAASLNATHGMESIVPRVQTVVQDSVNKIDTKELTRQITEALIRSTVEPVAKTNRQLEELLKLLTNLVEKAQEACQKLRNLAWQQIVLTSLGIAFVFWAVIFIWTFHEMKNSFDAGLELQTQRLQFFADAVGKMHGTVLENQLVFDQLSRLQITLDVKPVSGDPGHYVLILPEAEEARVDDGKGEILFRGNDISTLLEQDINDNHKSLGH